LEREEKWQLRSCLQATSLLLRSFAWLGGAWQGWLACEEALGAGNHKHVSCV